ncbi:hypothetical protein [Legionella massiliensis]|nr:hypothetical protein [Legionella massiliensis]
MTVHVFIGAGPANLHRALKIKRIDPKAKIVIIDDRLRPEHKDIDRVRARANIFRFENEDVTAKLLADGINQEKLLGLMHQRQFSVRQGFQHHDDKVFSSKPFSQIQIRDLQLILIDTLCEDEANPPLLIKKKLDVDSNEAIQREVAMVLYNNRASLEGIDEENDIKIHVATGALHDDDQQAQIVYPEKIKVQVNGATDDVKAMPVTPLHGTTTFVITGKLSCDQLRRNQRSLDLTPWQEPLAAFGWHLVRPPRIRVFYANDILYIGAEIPAAMNGMEDKNAYELAITDYTRKIASLVFPDLDIASLPVNPYLRSRFPTPRGERGVVIHAAHQQSLQWGEGQLEADVSIMHHGDSRYLPHYQTGSGFVTGFLQNELYAEIYSRNNFADLIEWASAKDNAFHMDAAKVIDSYMALADMDEKRAVELFQAELFMTYSREIIEENKRKVGRYFNALHSQELNALNDKFPDLLEVFNRHGEGNYKHYSLSDFKGPDYKLAVIRLLKANNIGFLREVLPTILNKDFSRVRNSDLLKIRDMHVLDYERNIVVDSQETDVFTKAMQQLANSNFADLTDKVETIANLFETNKEIHCRAAISFFKSKHSVTIHKYAKDLRELVGSYHNNPEMLKSHVLSKTMKFHDKLTEGSSRRTLDYLLQVVDQEFLQEQAVNLAAATQHA